MIDIFLCIVLVLMSFILLEVIILIAELILQDFYIFNKLKLRRKEENK